MTYPAGCSVGEGPSPVAKGAFLATGVVVVGYSAYNYFNPEGPDIEKLIRELTRELIEDLTFEAVQEIDGKLGSNDGDRAAGPRPTKVGLLRMVSRIGESPFLVRHAKRAGKSFQKSIDHLTTELASGNLNPGRGTRPIGKGISEARANDGARVFFRRLSDGSIEILGKTTKNKSDQSAVIKEILELFGG